MQIKKHRNILIGILSILLFDMFIGFVWHASYKESRYDNEILSISKNNDVSPILVKAVIWKESKFNPRAVGKVGETGLMQIRELTALEWSRDNKMPTINKEHLFNPQTNITIGSWYLKKMLNRYKNTDDPEIYALADYNAGRRRVMEWIGDSPETKTNSAIFFKNIGIPSTQQYIKSIKKRKKSYRGDLHKLR